MSFHSLKIWKRLLTGALLWNSHSWNGNIFYQSVNNWKELSIWKIVPCNSFIILYFHRSFENDSKRRSWWIWSTLHDCSHDKWRSYQCSNMFHFERNTRCSCWTTASTSWYIQVHCKIPFSAHFLYFWYSPFVEQVIHLDFSIIFATNSRR